MNFNPGIFFSKYKNLYLYDKTFSSFGEISSCFSTWFYAKCSHFDAIYDYIWINLELYKKLYGIILFYYTYFFFLLERIYFCVQWSIKKKVERSIFLNSLFEITVDRI